MILFILSTQVWGSPAEERKESKIPILDKLDNFVGYRVNDIANNFDRFFATERADDELGRSRLRIRGNYRVQERASGEEDVQFRFNLRLPYLEQRVRYELEQVKDRAIKDDKEDKEPKADKPKVSKSGLDNRWILTGDTGVNVSLKPTVRVRGRVRKSEQTGTLIHRFVQEITWISSRDGFRDRVTLDTDHSFSEDLLFRFSNTIDWKISKKDFNTSHGPALLQRLSDDDALSYNAGLGTTVIEGIWFLSGYSLSVTYRRNLYKDIAYFDISPGIEFPKVWSFRRTPFIFAQLEFLFGNY